MLDASMGTYTESSRQNHDSSKAKQAEATSPADPQETTITPLYALGESPETSPSPYHAGFDAKKNIKKDCPWGAEPGSRHLGCTSPTSSTELGN